MTTVRCREAVCLSGSAFMSFPSSDFLISRPMHILGVVLGGEGMIPVVIDFILFVHRSTAFLVFIGNGGRRNMATLGKLNCIHRKEDDLFMHIGVVLMMIFMTVSNGNRTH